MRKIPFLIKSFTFYVLYSLNAAVYAAQPADHAEIIATAGPMVRKVAQVLDEKVIDSMIVTTCASYGAVAGNYLSIKIMNNVNLMAGGRTIFKADERFEDDIGRVLGMVAGYHTGQYLVYLRHKITDPLFPQIYNFGEAGLNAGKALCENTITWVSNYTCSKIQTWTNYLNAYAMHGTPGVQNTSNVQKKTS